MDKIKIEYCCFLNQSGYSQSAQDLIMALHESGRYDIKIHAFAGKPARPAVSDDRYSVFSKMIKKEHDNDSIQILHSIPTLQKNIKRKNKRQIAFATFETYDPPANWIKILCQNDGIITPSFFNYKIFAHTKIKKPIFHIPHCLDFETFNMDISPMRQYNKISFLFLGTWKERKGYKQLIEAWFSEFKEEDNVQLVIKTDKNKQARAYIEKIKKEMGISKGFAPIFVENKVFSEAEMPSFLKSFDCLLLPTMGEGFNLPGLQCMALGVPVVITNFSGCQDYANDRTATLLEPRGFVLKKNMDGIPQFRNKKWAFVSVEDIKRTMREIINNPAKIKKKSKNAYEEVSKVYTYKKTEELFREMIGTLYGI
jgi:glycosyltransferase involved in cell wall biosynthesis